MKPLSQFALLVLFALPAVHAEEYPILAQYDAQAEILIKMTTSATQASDFETIRGETTKLIQLGTDVMNLYATKNPVCAEQFVVFLSEVAEMENMDIESVHTRYHDGTGLPEAPRHCYFGRSQVVHPAMNLIRLKSTIDEPIRTEMLDELDEVIEHSKRIQKYLDNPPQA